MLPIKGKLRNATSPKRVAFRCLPTTVRAFQTNDPTFAVYFKQLALWKDDLREKTNLICRNCVFFFLSLAEHLATGRGGSWVLELREHDEDRGGETETGR
eukprot:TRINITY_DN5939_c0_g4_i1.p2 TRINITY_DN5939_c0_g4~~TRINITY_DN5939_c0_g4_i1.p2  ORF type:complete len:100 (-),score=4.63 TRINITY_DN5939_c0_g4_i1:241-540(-)